MCLDRRIGQDSGNTHPDGADGRRLSAVGRMRGMLFNALSSIPECHRVSLWRQWPPPPRRMAKPGIGVDVAVIADHDAGLDGEQIVAVVPLFALGLIGVIAPRGSRARLSRACGLCSIARSRVYGNVFRSNAIRYFDQRKGCSGSGAFEHSEIGNDHINNFTPCEW